MIPAFKTIQEQAEFLKGGSRPIQQRLPQYKSNKALAGVPDSEYLSLMSRRIFRAGLKHSMVDARWPDFEKVFYNFDIDAVRMMSDEDLEKLMDDRRIIRHWGKIKSVRANAGAIHELLNEYGGVGGYLAGWPGENIIGLWDDLKRRFSQLGGNSGPYFLRMAGKDTFILTKHVVSALNRWKVYAGEPKSKSARQKIQDVFNSWSEESGQPLCHISMILACSVD